MIEMKLKKGDRVWVKLPMNADIIRVNQRIGYTLRTDDGVEWSHFAEDEVDKIDERKHA